MPRIEATGDDLERRLVLARAFASEHGMPLGFHDEEARCSGRWTVDGLFENWAIVDA